ncbi:nucleotidyltransferase family protein [Tardiphaga sp. 866_E4_N2_1]|uniref:nucleotidyltransferase family protein n=1 Tax=unclassified Tardiphaga TaxID=2631404 RepID=UPI003F2455D0
MSNVQETLVGPLATIKDVIETIERSSAKVALVVDADRRLLGTVTDGDVRRGLLRGVNIDNSASVIMNSKPRVASFDDDPAGVLDLLRKNLCRQVPILDTEGRVVALRTLDEALRVPRRPNPVFLMAGGRGQRLRPLTDNCPKPMLHIGGRPILQIIVENMVQQGFQDFYISVNYRREMIRQHFGDGSAWGASIRYIEEDEDKPLGTAGAISLLSDTPSHPMIVMNGDILTKVAFGALLDFHHEHAAVATMCVRDYFVQIPYGVIELDDHRIAEIVEKPVHRFLVNAGIYVLEPSAVGMIPSGSAYDMPTLFERLAADQSSASVFPITEYWLDIGRMDDFNKANDDYVREFWIGEGPG